FAVHHLEQGDRGVAGDAGRRRGDHGGDPGPTAALLPRAEHPRPELSSPRPGGRPERAVVRGVVAGKSPTMFTGGFVQRNGPGGAVRGVGGGIVRGSLGRPGTAAIGGGIGGRCTPAVLFGRDGLGGAVAEFLRGSPGRNES